MKRHNITISIFLLMLITLLFAIMNTHVAYGQANQGNSSKNNANSLNVQKHTSKKSSCWRYRYCIQGIW